ncbi:polysaccharide deacetylase family protein [Amycolatopsis cihanbeyliensis]|uniref:Peptidoglycan/xylan/chitin deacetylase (PgdA/CDA1 family) n=1 Tax=Amycolatopsis cihanbeyliensis TaxID=1128664 RepID=A0A542DF97_AMYCI|nr:polysaccharide deacetylase family protein [Amycolatopsis cihanbeyliensis]TQJ01768.1 peptidoglycan/xylan/chitin deacetylase (PgdA/CDA1 family) [Amycolatopsis cihanbeyliensis]
MATPAHRLPALLGALIIGLLAVTGCTAVASSSHQGKELYLTFDDGPGTDTGHILDVLEENDARAVFFAVGRNLDSHRDLARRAISEGHILANHTWDHQTLTTLDPAGLDAELDKATAELHQVGSTSPCVRPPSGATNEVVDTRFQEKGMRRVLWNVDTEDWREPGASVIARRLVDRATPGAVILMHDGGGDRSETVQALREALPELAARGYTFSTVPGC